MMRSLINLELKFQRLLRINTTKWNLKCVRTIRSRFKLKIKWIEKLKVWKEHRPLKWRMIKINKIRLLSNLTRHSELQTNLKTHSMWIKSVLISSSSFISFSNINCLCQRIQIFTNLFLPGSMQLIMIKMERYL